MEGDRGGVKDEPRVDRLVWVEVVGGREGCGDYGTGEVGVVTNGGIKPTKKNVRRDGGRDRRRRRRRGRGGVPAFSADSVAE